MKTKVVFIGLTLGVTLGLATGCSKKEDSETQAGGDAAAPAATEETAAAPAAAPAAEPALGAEKIPGENQVRRALAAKDYEGAVAQVTALRGQVRQDQWEHYVALQYEVRNTLGDASEADPKAAQALMTLNAMNRGR
jgi:hypothetical protein